METTPETTASTRPTQAQSLQKLRAKTAAAEEKLAISEACKSDDQFISDVGRSIRLLDRLKANWPATDVLPGELAICRGMLRDTLMGTR